MIIDIEGTDGCGKKTQTDLLFNYLVSKGYKVRKISFPNYESESSALVKMYLRGDFSLDANMVNGFQASAFYAVDRLATMLNIDINELVKKYKNWDIVIYYSTGSWKQIERLKQYAEVKQYKKGTIIECEKAFFNYKADIIDYVKAKDYYMIIHADYKAQGVPAPNIPKINHYIGVSQAACNSFTELTGKPCQLCYNPILLDPPKKTLRLVSATRLTKEKGKDRMIKLAKALDNANIPYEWTVYTNSKDTIKNSHVVYKPPTLDINGKLKEADYVVQLSDSESYCYTMVQALMLGTPVIVTPWNCLKELKITEEYGFILPFDMSNIPVQDIYTKEFNFKYIPPKDSWNEILAPGESQYQKDLQCLFEVAATDQYEKRKATDIELGCIPKPGQKWKVNKFRYDLLSGGNERGVQYVTLIRYL